MHFVNFYEECKPKLGVREPTFTALFEHLTTCQTKVIVETGCLRQPGNWAGDGQSTLLFDSYAAAENAKFWSVDISAEAITAARDVVSPRTQLVLGDSVRFLSVFNETIDVLYLDSFDLDKSNPFPAALHHLMELCAARSLLKSGSVVIVDDTWEQNGGTVGKGQLVAKFMRQIGAKRLANGYQDVWLMP